MGRKLQVPAAAERLWLWVEQSVSLSNVQLMAQQSPEPQHEQNHPAHDDVTAKKWQEFNVCAYLMQ